MPEFLHAVMRRKIAQWAVAYVAAAFALLQGIDIVAQQFAWPDAVRRGITIVLVVGFFVTLVLAWYHGERGNQRVTGTELLIVALLLAVGAGFLWSFARTPVGIAASGAQQAQPTANAPAPAAVPSVAAASAAISPKSIAVLPFENLSADANNAYFAAGIQDEILTRLARIGDLQVISRTSTEKYRARPENLRTVAQELGVAHILEGSVQKAMNQVLINVQLIDARSDEHLWAQSYKRTLDDVFAVEGEVAQQVAVELKAKLTDVEQQYVAARTTDNADAYDAYLRGLDIARQAVGFAPETFAKAEKEFAEAVRLDPKFAVAWSHLSEMRTHLYEFFLERTPEMLGKAKQAAATALELDPQLGEGYLALARYHYLALRDMAGALPPLQKARELLPNSAAVLTTLGQVEERQNRWKEANEHLRLAVQLDPRAIDRLSDLADNYYALREYVRAREILDRALRLAPDNSSLMAAKASVYISEGDLDAAGLLLDKVAYAPQDPGAFFTKLQLAAYRRDYSAAIAALEKAVAAPDLHPRLLRSVYRAQLGRNLELDGRRAQAVPVYEQALAGLQAGRKSEADDHVLAEYIAEVHAGLGDGKQALQWARRNVEANSTCSLCKASAEAALARTQARFGETGAAIAALPHLLTMPNGPSVADLRLGPGWDPLRKDPRFETILKRYENAAVVDGEAGS